MKRLIIAGVTVSLVMAMSGCAARADDVSTAPETPAPAETQTPTSDIYGVVSSYVELPDGRIVLCVATSEYAYAGISCDWDHATER